MVKLFVNFYRTQIRLIRETQLDRGISLVLLFLGMFFLNATEPLAQEKNSDLRLSDVRPLGKTILSGVPWDPKSLLLQSKYRWDIIFPATDFIAQISGPLIVLFGYGGFHLVAQVEERTSGCLIEDFHGQFSKHNNFLIIINLGSLANGFQEPFDLFNVLQ